MTNASAPTDSQLAKYSATVGKIIVELGGRTVFSTSEEVDNGRGHCAGK